MGIARNTVKHYLEHPVPIRVEAEPSSSAGRRILEGKGTAPHLQRRAAFDNDRLDEAVKMLVRKVAERAHSVTDDDIARARQAGLSEDQIFEIVVCAAVGQATRQFESAAAALDAAVAKG